MVELGPTDPKGKMPHRTPPKSATDTVHVNTSRGTPAGG